MYEVELQQNDADENIYRLVNPYGAGTPVGEINASTRRGYIQFNISDPDHVYFYGTKAGFSLPEGGISEFYCIDQLTALAATLGIEPPQVASLLGD